MTQKQRIEELLSDGEWHHFRELNDICFRYSSRLYDLRQEGKDHEIKKDGKVNYYRLIPSGKLF